MDQQKVVLVIESDDLQESDFFGLDVSILANEGVVILTPHDQLFVHEV